MVNEKGNNDDKELSVLHITPHLGGGVGKALVSLINASDPQACF